MKRFIEAIWKKPCFVGVHSPTVALVGQEVQVGDMLRSVCLKCERSLRLSAAVGAPPAGWLGTAVFRNVRLWCSVSPRAPPTGDLRVHALDGDWESDSASQEPRELTFVDEDTFWATF
jgi:hypothetical protein